MRAKEASEVASFVLLMLAIYCAWGTIMKTVRSVAMAKIEGVESFNAPSSSSELTFNTCLKKLVELAVGQKLQDLSPEHREALKEARETEDDPINPLTLSNYGAEILYCDNNACNSICGLATDEDGTIYEDRITLWDSTAPCAQPG